MLEDALVGLATCPALEKVTSEVDKRVSAFLELIHI
jgi:hypothetical protein